MCHLTDHRRDKVVRWKGRESCPSLLPSCIPLTPSVTEPMKTPMMLSHTPFQDSVLTTHWLAFAEIFRGGFIHLYFVMSAKPGVPSACSKLPQYNSENEHFKPPPLHFCTFSQPQGMTWAFSLQPKASL